MREALKGAFSIGRTKFRNETSSAWRLSTEKDIKLDTPNTILPEREANHEGLIPKEAERQIKFFYIYICS